ncbi:cupredoxin domain-containing protein [Streptomyces sp. NPDC017993]|uniref:cupredoxin domain-containing protein n=1 Tax=Streptomyces sp. NPDC017993 TaxID=3365027 RepID=UPI00379B975C
MPLLRRRPHRPSGCRAALAASFLCLAALTGCSDGGGGSSGDTTPSASPSSPAAGGTRITIKDFAFGPADLTVRPGAKVTVVNEDSTAHDVTATGAKAFKTGTIGPGRTATFTAPAKSGNYDYLCTIHPSMKGALTVR